MVGLLVLYYKGGDEELMDASFLNVLSRDGLAKSWAIIFAVSCMLLGVSSVADNSAAWMEYARLFLVLTAFFTGGSVILRVGSVTALLIRGSKVEGSVSREPSGKQLAGITKYTFLHDNERVWGRVIMSGSVLKRGQRVTVCYDPKRPENSVVRDVFL